MYKKEFLERSAKKIEDSEMWLIVIDYHEPATPHVILHKPSGAHLLVEKDDSIKGPHGKWLVYDAKDDYSSHRNHWNAIRAAKLLILKVVTQMV